MEFNFMLGDEVITSNMFKIAVDNNSNRVLVIGSKGYEYIVSMNGTNISIVNKVLEYEGSVYIDDRSCLLALLKDLNDVNKSKSLVMDIDLEDSVYLKHNNILKSISMVTIIKDTDLEEVTNKCKFVTFLDNDKYRKLTYDKNKIIISDEIIFGFNGILNKNSNIEVLSENIVTGYVELLELIKSVEE